MAGLRCLCGETVPGDGEDALRRALHAHAAEQHADFPLTESRAREIVAAHLRMTPWDGARAPLAGPVAIRALEPGRAADFLGFFDREAFADNPMWASCYCMYHHFAGEPRAWGTRTETENRAEKAELVRSGRARGWLAYAGDRVVGWCHAAPRGELPALAREPELDQSSVGSIVCFVVAPAFRGQGVAGRLLDRACAGFREQGFSLAEAYPRRAPGSEADAFHGPLEMYLAAGFTIAHQAERVVVVRREL